MKFSKNNKTNNTVLLYCFVFFALGLSVITKAQAKVKRIDSFSYAEAPIADLGEPLVLWATNYHLPQFSDETGDVPLRDFDGNELGPKLSLADWCKCALEGSATIVSKDGVAKTYNFYKSTEFFVNDCSAFYPFNLGKSKFRLARGRFGDGVANNKLAPYRTIATDPLIIPTGTVLYIPEARGTFIHTPEGVVIIHDGYFIAGDIGGGIKLNHIDVFIGTHDDSSFFSWISHTSTLTFKAYIVKDADLITDLSILTRH